MKNLLLLNTSIVVEKPLFRRDKIKLEYGAKRIESYLDGFKALRKTKTIELFDEVALADNTVLSSSKLPKPLTKLLPANTNFYCNKNNSVGRLNKGAGMLESLKSNRSLIESYDLIFYFEPRLIIFDNQVINLFLKAKHNIFSLETNTRVKTGYFGTRSEDLIHFIDLYSSEKLIADNLHIEDLMYDHYKDKTTSFMDIDISLWKNYLSNKYEKY